MELKDEYGFKGPYPVTYISTYFLGKKVKNESYFTTFENALEKANKEEKVTGITVEKTNKGETIYTLRTSKKGLKINQDNTYNNGIESYIKKEYYKSPPIYWKDSNYEKCKKYFELN